MSEYFQMSEYFLHIGSRMVGDLHFIWYSINIYFAEHHNENMVNFRTLKSPLENTFISIVI